jgi:pyruvate dehydrogenase E2 component (dihydrolipoamide acetyltransferase)
MAEFRMPSLGADMEAGTLVEWLKQPGEAVHRGDIVAVVETDKGAIEIEIFLDGVMGRQLIAPNTKVPVGTPLAVIEGVLGGAPTPRPPQAAPKSTTPTLVVKKAPAAAMPPSGVRVTPAARQAAATHGIPLETLKGTGPGGAIVLADVEKAAAMPPAKRIGLDLEKMRRAIAAAMAKSKREIPHYYLATDIDMSRALTWLADTNGSRTPATRLLPAALTLKAVALALRKYPKFNGFYREPEGFAARDTIHIGTAISIRGGGLVSPAIHDCDRLSLDEMMTHLRDLAARAREGRLRSSELTDPTITVSSLGDRGVDSLFGIIYPPQVAIVGFGRTTAKPIVVADRVEARQTMTATLAADHRVTDGHLGSLFLNTIAGLLQEPDKL